MAPWALDDGTLPTAMAVMAATVLAAALALSARMLLVVARTLRASDRLTVSPRRMLRWLARGASDHERDPEVEAQVRRLLDERRVETGRNFITWAEISLCGRKMLLLLDVVQGNEREYSLGEDVSLVLLQAVCTFFASLPSLNERTMRLAHILIEIVLAMGVTPAVRDYDGPMMLFRMISTFGAFAAGFIFLEPRLVLATNFVFSCVMIGSAAASLQQEMGVSMETIVGIEMSTLVLRAGILAKASAFMEDGVRREVTTKSDACQRSAVSGLLGLMCDAVVDLG
eukprot:CAMPEP_0176185030 /NCGR_PEP_ID=MMETSP0121_2-20121125/1138_1 /TAXON_ID=160619 /ORGANISM="Kryptoperidinium foliaceum, Strain CCMP 1326" /LENGTH=283 /DNA_ID=CAMNT_0017523459 /DNA_START=15 /DNA_END=863 /DNA_ORIENTATION=+